MRESQSSGQVIYETNRLIVRPYTTDDAEFVFGMYSRWDVQRFLGANPRPLQSLAEASSAIERWRSVSAQGPGLGCWAVELKTGGLIGTVMLKRVPLSSPERPMPLSDDLEVGWHLHPDRWGKGYATEMSAGALRLPPAAGATEVLALIVPGNERSKHVAERLGMTYQGTTDRYYSIDADVYVTRPGQAGR